LRVAADLFVDRTYSGTAIRDIASMAGVNQALIYRHFSSKEALLLEALVEPTSETRAKVFATLSDLAAAALTGDDEHLLHLNREMLSATVEALPALGSLIYADPALAVETFGQHYREPMQKATNRIVRLASSSKIEVDRVTAQCLVIVIFGVNLAFALHEIFGATSSDADEFTAEATTILLEGLLEHPPESLPTGRELVASAREVWARTAVEDPAPRDDRRSELLSSARQIFAERGRKLATVKAISQLADVTEATLYRYFVTKQDLFNAAMLEPFQAVTADTVRLGAAFKDVAGPERLPLGLGVNSRLGSVFGEISTLLLISLFSDRQEGAAFYRSQFEPLLNEVAKALHQNMSTTARRRASARTLMFILVGMHLSAAIYGHYDGSPIDEFLLAGVISYIVSFGGESLKGAAEALSMMRASFINGSQPIA
jgi:AcrR family transcriptional regulator